VNALGTYAVGYIAVVSPTRALAHALDTTVGLTRLSSVTTTSVWKVPSAVGQLAIRPASGDFATPTIGVPSSADGAKTAIPAGTAGRTLVLADAARGGWRATLDGHALTPTVVDGWAQGFELPAQAGRLVLHYDSSRRDGWLALQLAVLMLVLVLAAPSVRSEDALWPTEDDLSDEGQVDHHAAQVRERDDREQVIDDVEAAVGETEPTEPVEQDATLPESGEPSVADATETDGVKVAAAAAVVKPRAPRRRTRTATSAATTVVTDAGPAASEGSGADAAASDRPAIDGVALEGAAAVTVEPEALAPKPRAPRKRRPPATRTGAETSPEPAAEAEPAAPVPADTPEPVDAAPKPVARPRRASRPKVVTEPVDTSSPGADGSGS
jgi:hypothetical protein